MNVQVKSSNGITLIPVESCLMTGRNVFVEGEINAESACEFVKKILYLNGEDEKTPIRMFINSLGGEINAGLLMYDVIQSSPAPIETYCLGSAYSMGAVLFASGNHGRYMLPHSKLMIHEPLLGGRVGGSSSTIQSVSKSLQSTKRLLDELLAAHTKKSVREIAKATGYDHYFNAEESVAFGLCDEIMNFDKMIGGKRNDR